MNTTLRGDTGMSAGVSSSHSWQNPCPPTGWAVDAYTPATGVMARERNPALCHALPAWVAQNRPGNEGPRKPETSESVVGHVFGEFFLPFA